VSNPAPPTRIGDMLHIWRTRDEKSKAAVGREFGVRAMTIRRWEEGELPDARNFLSLCERLGVEPNSALLDEPIEGEDLTAFLDKASAKADSALRQVREFLTAIVTSDKTPPYSPGDLNNEGKTPDGGAVFLTPRRLATLALTRIHDIVGSDEGPFPDAD